MLAQPELDPKKLDRAIKVYRDGLAAALAAGDSTELALKHPFAHLLRTLGPQVGWALREEMRPDADKSIQFDGALVKNFLTRGVWEAKGPGANLKAEIARKVEKRYPLHNILFENTRAAILYQNGQPVAADPFDITQDGPLKDLLGRFFAHTSPNQEGLDAAVKSFGGRTVQLSQDLDRLVKRPTPTTPPSAPPSTTSPSSAETPSTRTSPPATSTTS